MNDTTLKKWDYVRLHTGDDRDGLYCIVENVLPDGWLFVFNSVRVRHYDVAPYQVERVEV